MASLIPITEPMQHGLLVPITLDRFQEYIGAFIEFIPLPCGDYMVVAEVQAGLPRNQTASALAGFRVCGIAVLCQPSEIA